MKTEEGYGVLLNDLEKSNSPLNHIPVVLNRTDLNNPVVNINIKYN